MSGEKLSLFMRKILSPGVAYCNLCCQEVNYSSCGKVVLEDCVRTAKCKSTLRADLLQRKQSRVPYLASSQQSRDKQFWKWVCRKIVSRFTLLKAECKYSASAVIETYFASKDGTDFILGFQTFSWGHAPGPPRFPLFNSSPLPTPDLSCADLTRIQKTSTGDSRKECSINKILIGRVSHQLLQL